MVSSVIYSAVMAGIFSKLSMIDTKLIVFDTNVVDLTDYVSDPVETLLSVQLGGGTDISKALDYAASKITQPQKTIVVLVSDLYDGYDYRQMYKRVFDIIETGARMFVLPALDYSAQGSYDKNAAQKMANLGADVAAITPKELAQWIAKNSIINEIKSFLPFINEEFIVSISNKGIYKRSVKDLEKARENISLAVKDTGLIEVKIEDAVVELNVNIQNSKCTCPSSSICKHIVMALLYLKEFYDNNQDGAEEIKEEAKEEIDETVFYEELKKLTGEKVLELVGKKNYNSLINSIFYKK